MAMPLYVWMGNILFESKIGEDMFEAANRWVGRLPGGLAIASTFACAVFGLICGSSTACAITVGSVSIPAMRNRGYSDEISTGVMASAGILAILIPPSITMILYATITETSIGKLFFAGFIPGFILAALFTIYLFLRGVFTPSAAPRGESFSWRARMSSLPGLVPVVLLFAGVFAGIYTGVFTATEAGAMGVLMAIIISAAYRRLSLHVLWKSLMDTMRVCGSMHCSRRISYRY